MKNEKEIIQLRDDFEMISNHPDVSSMDRLLAETVVSTLHGVLGIDPTVENALKAIKEKLK